MKKLIFCLTFILYLLFVISGVNAATVQVPQWYKLNARLDAPPVVGKAVKLTVELQAIIGDLKNISVKLILPDRWQADKITKELKKIDSSKTDCLEFSIIPKTELSQGSIVIEATFDIPKSNINQAIDKTIPEKEIADSLKASVNAWPSPTKRYADTSFAIFPEESFYPLSGDMWISYADEMSPDKKFRGPAYYSDSMISLHQAQTDVEMYNKLTELLKTDESLADKLAGNGVDLAKKHFDYLNGLYVLAVDAWKKQDYQAALNFLELLEKESSSLKKAYVDYLKISTNNIRALIFWQQGQRRLAEEAFKKAFYQNKKHKLQRYILRNLGLFMYSVKDKATAKQMFELAKGFKSGYTLLDKETELLKIE